MSSKRQQTMAKMTRERTVRERRAKKLEKKQAARAEKRARAAGEWPVQEPMDGEEAAAESAAVPAEQVVPAAEPEEDAGGGVGV